MLAPAPFSNLSKVYADFFVRLLCAVSRATLIYENATTHLATAILSNPTRPTVCNNKWIVLNIDRYCRPLAELDEFARYDLVLVLFDGDYARKWDEKQIWFQFPTSSFLFVASDNVVDHNLTEALRNDLLYMEQYYVAIIQMAVDATTDATQYSVQCRYIQSSGHQLVLHEDAFVDDDVNVWDRIYGTNYDHFVGETLGIFAEIRLPHVITCYDDKSTGFCGTWLHVADMFGRYFNASMLILPRFSSPRNFRFESYYDYLDDVVNIVHFHADILIPFGETLYVNSLFVLLNKINHNFFLARECMLISKAWH